MRTIDKVLILGNGAMGAGAAAVFAGAGLATTLIARTFEKAAAGKARAEALAKQPLAIACATYAELADAVRDADFVLECVAEDLALKRGVFETLDRAGADAIVASVSSGLSITAMCADRTPGFRARFLGVHLFNPPTQILGCELIAHAETSAETRDAVRALLARLQRRVVECADTPGFAGNRLGFKVLNEVAQLAEQHGVAYMDALLGPHTGRALAPLATIDLVGWDVHKAIVDHLHAHTGDPAFALPAYIQRGIDRGHLGRKTRDKGGFFRLDADKRQHVLDPATGAYRPRTELAPPCQLVEDMQAAADLDAMMEVMCTADGAAAAVLRRVVLGYISYGLGLVGTVVAEARDIDRIMGFGFHWAPPSMLADAIGPPRTIALLERAALAVPPVLAAAARAGTPLSAEPGLERATFFRRAA